MEKRKISIYYTDEVLPTEYSDVFNILKQRYDVVIDEFSPQYLFYGPFGNLHAKYKDCVKISILREPLLPNFQEADYVAGTAFIEFGDRYFRKIAYHNNITPAIEDRSDVSPELLNRKFCNFIFSNADRGEGAVMRTEFCKELMKYKHVDCLGSVLNNASDPRLTERISREFWTSKQDVVKEYKFMIAFENTDMDGWVTEKMLDAFTARSVPIYYGSSSINKEFNPKAFINIADYDFDFGKVIKKIIELDNDDEAYLAMLKENPVVEGYAYDHDARFAQWLYQIIENADKPFNKDPFNFVGNVEKWNDFKNNYRNKIDIPEETTVSLIKTVDEKINILLKRKAEEDKKAEKTLKLRFNLIKYRLFYHISFGKTKKHYKRKYKELRKTFLSFK